MSKQDFAFEQDNLGFFDLIIDPATKDFKAVEGMETAIDIQLFTNQRVSKQERALPLDRQGWSGDMESRSLGYQMGSLLFLQSQARDTPLDNNETASYAKNALDYLVVIGASKDVTSRVIGKNIEGTIINEDNSVSRYNKLWRDTKTDVN